MKAAAPVVQNKKLIFHFDVNDVLSVAATDKDLYIYELCAGWVWGKLERTAKDDPEKVTGWKLVSPNLSLESPEADLCTYKHYVDTYLHPPPEERAKLIGNLSKGPAVKAKTQIEKCIKNITIPKALLDSLSEAAKVLEPPHPPLYDFYLRTGKYQILPAFFKFVLWLKKNKREFAIVIKCDQKDPKFNHRAIIDQLNLFFTGEHPLYNGKNGVPLVKLDGSKGNKNFVLESHHLSIRCYLGEGAHQELLQIFGTLEVNKEKDPQMFKQTLKGNKAVKLMQGINAVFAKVHTSLTQSACLYEVDPNRVLLIDQVDYFTQEIYFHSDQNMPVVKNCIGNQLDKTKTGCFVSAVAPFEYFRDVDFFVKRTEHLETVRAAQVIQIEKGQAHEQEKDQKQQETAPQTDAEFLRRKLLPVLEGALRQVDIYRPEDPLAFIAHHCLKFKDLLDE